MGPSCLCGFLTTLNRYNVTIKVEQLLFENMPIVIRDLLTGQEETAWVTYHYEDEVVVFEPSSSPN